MLPVRVSQQVQRPTHSPSQSRRKLVVPVVGCSAKTAATQVLESPISPKLPPQREVAPPPEAAPVIHSRAFLIKNSKLPLPQRLPQTEQDASRLEASYAASPATEAEGSLRAIIKKMDQQLNEIEANPPVVQKALFDVSQGPIGQATSRGISAAAKLTVHATVEAAKIAAPVGRWALQEGMKAAMQLIARTVVEEKQPTGTRKIKKGRQ